MIPPALVHEAVVAALAAVVPLGFEVHDREVPDLVAMPAVCAGPREIERTRQDEAGAVLSIDVALVLHLVTPLGGPTAYAGSAGASAALAEVYGALARFRLGRGSQVEAEWGGQECFLTSFPVRCTVTADTPTAT